MGTGRNGEARPGDFWAYDPAADQWVARQKLHQLMPLQAYGVGFASSTRGYFPLGDDNSTAVWEYDPVRDSWAAQTSFGGTSRPYAVGFTLNGKGYVGTGGSRTNVYDDLWMFTMP